MNSRSSGSHAIFSLTHFQLKDTGASLNLGVVLHLFRQQSACLLALAALDLCWAGLALRLATDLVLLFSVPEHPVLSTQWEEAV